MIQIVSALSAQIGTLIFVLTIFNHIPDINGWSYGEILFIYGFSQTSMALFSMFFSNLINLGRLYILDGNLDRVLLRPLPPLLQIIIERLDIGSFSTLALGFGALSYAAVKLNLSFSYHLLFFFVVLIFSAVLILGGVVLILVSLTFWVKDPTGAIAWPLMTIRDFAKYPITIYSAPLQVFLSWILPLAFTSFYPATLFLERTDYIFHVRMTPLIALLTWGIGLFIWKRGLQRYESAGS
ncbi:MAG: ABC-2 family transporter protein [Candidatus Poribacteria bacterium]|nr:ABC-2 family transporter protein [Candidatus Poribacteria bacterium]